MSDLKVILRSDVSGLGTLGDIVCRHNQFSKQRFFFDDLGVMKRIGNSWSTRLQCDERAGPANGVEHIGLAEFVGNGDRIDSLTCAVQGLNRIEDVPVGWSVKVI